MDTIDGRIVIEWGLPEGQSVGIDVTVTVESPAFEDMGLEPDLPSRILTEGALSMARDSIAAIYDGAGDED